jgi:hypothetical protein
VLEDAALANLSTRVDRIKTTPGSGYATIGSGTKTVAPDAVAGLALGPDEPYENSTAAEVFERRTGTPLAGAAGHLRLATLESANDESVLGGELGLLGDALAEAEVDRGVVANADQSTLHGELLEYHREAMLGLAGSNGIVPCGRIDKDLLVDDPAMAFGIALSPARVTEAFLGCWERGGVVLVEGSDLARTEAYQATVTESQRDTASRRALEYTDELLADVIAAVDPERDAVVIVSPSAPVAGDGQLTVFAVRAPGLDPGLLESASTRQPGFVTMVDVAPTIGELAGVELDVAEIDGRAVTRSGDGGDDLDARIDRLVEVDNEARFRDRILAPTVSAFITADAIMALVAIVVLWRGLRLPKALGVGALAVLFALPLTYLSALLPFAEWGAAAYAAFVFGGGLACALVADRLDRHGVMPVVVAFAAMLLTTALSVVVLGSELQLSTVFGDSPIVAGRFSGVNNVTFAQVMVASILLGVGIVHRWPERRGRIGMVALFAATLVMLGAPMWGADVGGVLAGVSAFAVTATLLAGWRVRWRSVVVYGVITLVLVLALGVLDLARDPSDRSHLGRLFERIGADGWSGLATVVRRKLEQNLRTLTSSAWRFILVPVIALAVLIVWRAPGRIRSLVERFPGLRAGLIGIAVAGTLGYAVNDSGIAVPGMMLAVLTPAALFLLARFEPEPPPEAPAVDADAERREPVPA